MTDDVRAVFDNLFSSLRSTAAALRNACHQHSEELGALDDTLFFQLTDITEHVNESLDDVVCRIVDCERLGIHKDYRGMRFCEEHRERAVTVAPTPYLG